MSARGPSKPPWFSEHSGMALFTVGCALVLAVVLGPERSPAVAAGALFVGGAMVLIGSLLPRLTGTIKITPASIEMALAERLDATRREALMRTPGHEDEAIGRAFEMLLPWLRAAELIPPAGEEPARAAGKPHAEQQPPAPPAVGASAPQPRASGPRWRWAPAAAVLVFATAAGLTVLTVQAPQQDPAPTEEPRATEEPTPQADPAPTEERTATEEPTPTEEPTLSGPGMAVLLAGVLLAGAGAAAQATRRARRRRAADEPLAGAFAVPPDVFAQRIVDELTGEQDDGGKPPFQADRT